MTSTITEVIQTTMTRNTADTLTTTISVMTILLLLVLLFQKELTRSGGKSRTSQDIQVLNTAVVPLLLIFGLLLAIRLAHFLHGG